MIATLAEAKTQLRVQHSLEDSYITSLIKEAQEMAEVFCRVDFDDMEDGEDPPLAAKRAVLLMVSFLYENRDMHDAQARSVTMKVFHDMLWPYRDVTKMF